ncbi:MAG: LysR family transcriptional regulator [Rugosibacter sp.]|jgi:DNA-binding transcriptional LysR family regulator|nr:LysR family transcriptional regulator [Rugosibacter sp.]
MLKQTGNEAYNIKGIQKTCLYNSFHSDNKYMAASGTALKNMKLRSIDLNLLVAFHRLYIDRNVSRAADNLGLSQPAMSNTLKRLRQLTGDELFVRTSAGMAPTLCAEELAAPLAQALATIQETLSHLTSFNPAKSSRKFAISAFDIGESYLMPRLMDRLAKEAPGVTLQTTRAGAGDSLKLALESGEVDFALGHLPHLQAGFFQRRLFLQHYVCAFRRGHPMAGSTFGINEFQEADHLTIVTEGSDYELLDKIMADQAPQRKIRLRVSHFLSTGYLLRDTNLIATIPNKLAEILCEPFGLVYVPHPITLPPTDINLLWHARSHRDPACQWLRKILFELFTE